MINKTSVEKLTEYALGQSQWKQMPTGTDYSLGVEPEDRAPAEWWNALFGIITKNIGNSSTDFTSVVTEINSVLAAVGITPDPLETNQLLSSVEALITDSSSEVQGNLDTFITSITQIVDQNKTNIENALNTHENKISDVHGSTASAINNSVMQRNASGQADITDPLDTNDEGIVNVGYAKEKAIEGYGQKTDCILKTGLNIDLEWDSEKTVVKQGTTLIKPDGSPLGISKDITLVVPSTDGTWLIIADGGSYVHRYKTDTVFSSSVDPTGSVYTAWYNYETKIFYLRSGDTWAPKTSYSLPFAQVTVENGVFTDVQKLDSISYFGTTLFAIPETKILVASGRNEDGSLNSIEYTVSSLSQRNNVRQVTNQIVLDPYSGVYNSNTTYNYVLNRYYDNNALYRFCSVGKVTSANGVVITSIATKRPFFTADLQSGVYGDTNTLPASEIKELVDEGGTTLESHMQNTNSAHGGMSDVATGGTLARRKTNGQLEFAKGTGTGNLGATMANIVDTLNEANEDATAYTDSSVFIPATAEKVTIYALSASSGSGTKSDTTAPFSQNTHVYADISYKISGVTVSLGDAVVYHERFYNSTSESSKRTVHIASVAPGSRLTLTFDYVDVAGGDDVYVRFFSFLPS